MPRRPLLRLFENAEMPGFIHSYIGEEATGVGVCAALRQDDVITSTHRGHGHIIAKGGDLNLFFAELYGKAAGYCKGKGGSMHVADLDLGIYGANGIVGGGIPIAAGAALAAQHAGTTASRWRSWATARPTSGRSTNRSTWPRVWNLPVVFVVENNGFADFIRVRDHQKIAQSLGRAAGYGMPGETVDGNDVEAVQRRPSGRSNGPATGGGPTLLECVTYRWRGHFEGDPQPYRTSDEVEAWKRRDPLQAAPRRGWRERGLPTTRRCDASAETVRQVDEAVDVRPRRRRCPSRECALEDVYTDLAVEGWS